RWTSFRTNPGARSTRCTRFLKRSSKSISCPCATGMRFVTTIMADGLPRRPRGATRGQGTIEVVRSADQAEVREGLREVAEMLTRGSELLGVEAQVVRIAEHLLEVVAGFFELAGACEALGVPERADAERALFRPEPVVRPLVGAVAVNERVVDEIV